ncbi:helix-turn-helix domain-containing protein [Streptomyces sp. NPDC059785]|uniref:helix-turn-helix domain-containing protein n=1 Tax=Streptomyces sp. NPDC059785 TaxID=3346945 RepID=UPI00366489C5
MQERQPVENVGQPVRKAGQPVEKVASPRGSANVMSVSTDSVSGLEGFGWWGDMVGRTVMPVTITSPYSHRFTGRATTLDLVHTEVSGFAFSPMSARRTHAHIRMSDPETYFLFLVHGSPVALEQSRNEILLQAGDMAIFDTSRPLSCEFVDQERASRVTLMRLPRGAVPLPGDRTDSLVATRLPARTGSGALLISYLTALRVNAAQYTAPELQRLGATGLELAATFLATRLDLHRSLPVETRQAVLLARIDAFIDDRLGEPDLSPATIAAHHHISIRTLHALFRQRPETVAATIRRRRLEHCRADLADPLLRRRTIGDIAGRWGYRHPADFSRAFRHVYGMPPRDFRRECRSSD